MHPLTLAATTEERRFSEWGNVCICVTVVVATTAYSYQLTSFLIAKELVVFLGLLVLAVLSWDKRGVHLSGFKLYLPLWIALAVALCVGLFQEIGQARRCEDAVRFGSWLLFASLAFPLLGRPAWRERVVTGVIASGCVVALLGLLQYANLIPSLFPVFPEYTQRIYSVFGNQDLFGGYLAVVVPLVLGRLLSASGDDSSGGKRGSVVAACVLLEIILLWGVVLSRSRSAWLACIVGLVAVLWVYRGSGRRIYWGGFLVVCLGGILVVLPETREHIFGSFGDSDVGGRARLWFWDGTVGMIGGAPWLGVGLGSYSYWSPQYLGLALYTPGGETHYHNELHTIHAHSEPLEIMAETGVLGIVFWCWFFIRVVRRVRFGIQGKDKFGALGAVVALAVFSCFNAALHSAPHALAGLLLVGILCGGEDRYGEKRLRVGGGLGWASVVGGVVLVFVVWSWTVLIPSYLLRSAEDLHVAGSDPVLRYEALFEHGWPNALGREEWGMALLDQGKGEEAYKQLQWSLRGRDTGRLYLLLGIAASQTGRQSEAREHFWACLARWPSNEYAYGFLEALEGAEARSRLEAHGTRWKISKSP